MKKTAAHVVAIAITFAGLLALAELKAPLVKLRGQWVELNADEIRQAVELWKKRSAQETTVRDIVQMALGTATTLDGVAFDGVTADGWIGELLAQLDDGQQEIFRIDD